MRRWIRPAMLLFPLAAGVFLPELAFLGRSPYNFIRWALMAMIFFSVLQMDFADLKPLPGTFFAAGGQYSVGTGTIFYLEMALSGFHCFGSNRIFYRYRSYGGGGGGDSFTAGRTYRFRCYRICNQ